MPSRPLIRIRPTVDLVFKAVMVEPAGFVTLLDFLNAVVEPKSRFVKVDVINADIPITVMGERGAVVDVRGTDAAGRRFHIEMQSWNHAGMRQRMLFGWAAGYRAQLREGGGHSDLLPVISIWVVDDLVVSGSAMFHHRFRAVDIADGTVLSDDLEIHLLELPKWLDHPDRHPLDDWAEFLTQAEDWSELPPHLRREPLEQAMSVIQRIQNDSQASAAYEAREEWLRVERSQAKATAYERAEKEKALAEKEKALAEAARERAEKERERAEKEQALAEGERERAEKETALAANEAALLEIQRLQALLRGQSGG